MNIKKLYLVTFGLSVFLSSVFLNPEILYKFSKQGNLNLANLEEKYDDNFDKAVFNNQKVNFISYKYNDIESQVLGETTPKQEDSKVIYVDLTNQRLYAFENDKLVYNFLVSTGKWGRTPTGVFHIWTKFKYTLMQGGSQALGTYYYLPNVPFTMFFYNEATPKSMGYGIHGTYWHDNFGHPMSHGCINMKTEEVEQLFYWATPDMKGQSIMAASSENPGTKIVIFGTAPQD
jgi:hypothetical protein